MRACSLVQVPRGVLNRGRVRTFQRSIKILNVPNSPLVEFECAGRVMLTYDSRSSLTDTHSANEASHADS